jgi:protein involved in polysaccharide export with SLBB domain
MRLTFLILMIAVLPVGVWGQEPAPVSVTLAPGDMIRVQIWREPELSGEFLVEQDGSVTLPLLGRRPVSGLLLEETLDALLSAYREQLRNPSIILTPLRRVYVLGEVNQPGLRLVDPTISLAGAVALAGGASPNGDLSRIRVIRQGEVVLENVAADSGLALVDIRSGDEIFVGRRGWFDRNSTFVVSALLSVTSLIVSILR